MHKEAATNQKFLMNPNQTDNKVYGSTYALLVRSEEKERNLLETIAYCLFMLSAVAAIWQFAQQPLDLPLATMPQTAAETQVDCTTRS